MKDLFSSRVLGALALPLLVSAIGCDGPAAAPSDGGPRRDAPPSDGSRADTGPIAPSDPDYSACGGRIFDPTTGALDPAEYDRQAHLWDRDAIDCRLGPTWAELHPGGVDDRPTLFEPAHDPARLCGGGSAFQTYEFGATGCPNSCPDGSGIDYLSTSAQVGYEPDLATAFGVDRLTTFGVIGQLVAVGPQFGPPRESTHPDQDLLAPGWPARGFSSRQLVALARARSTGGYAGHQALGVFEDGFVGGLGTITDGVSGGLDILQVGFDFPDHLVPTAVAISSHDELAFVTVWDTDAHVGRLAVFAMHSNFPLYDLQTWWYAGLPSSGAFTGMKYLGTIELPIATPTSIAAVTNGQQQGPHTTGGRRLGEFALIHDGACDPTVAAQFSVEVAEPMQTADVVPTNGYVVIASRWEHRVVLVDLAPLLTDLRRDYFEDMAFCNEHIVPAHVWQGEAEGIGNNPGSHQFDGEDRWPFPFVRETTTGPTLAPPVVAATFELDAPIDVEAGFERAGDSGPMRAFVLQQDGTLQTIEVERLFSPSPRAAPPTAEPHLGVAVDVCDHPTSLAMRNSNRWLWVACRGDRALQSVTFDATGGMVSTEIRDALLEDPVAIDTNDRGPIITVADFLGRQVVNYQYDAVTFSCASVPLETSGVVQRGGAMSIDGTPWLLSGANVN
jgi:hypothetical protein